MSKYRGAWVKLVLAAVLAVGLGVTVALVARFGLASILTSLARLGVYGFALFCAYTLGVFLLLGVCWFVIAPGLPLGQLPAFIVGRLMREAAADVLPFSQLGGFVMGARVAALLGASPVMAVASSVVDLAAEMVGQLLFTALGVAVLWRQAPSGFPHRLVDPILTAGLLVGSVTAALFIFSQRMGLRLLGRFSQGWPAAMKAQLISVQDTLRDLYRRPARSLLSVILHFVAWIAATGGVWMVLMLMGARLGLPAVIAMESLIYIIRSAAFAVPGAIGVLEGGYVVLGPLFGLTPETALSLSLIKRGRDLAIGLPMILIWQTLEGRRFILGGSAGRRGVADPAAKP